MFGATKTTELLEFNASVRKRGARVDRKYILFNKILTYYYNN